MLLLFVVPAGDGCFVIWIDTMRRQQYGVAMPALFGAVWTGALGFALSRHKKVYLTLGGIVLIFAVLHGWACLSAGYNGWQNPIYDLTNYIRVVQIPLFTLCFITFLRENGRGRLSDRGTRLCHQFWTDCAGGDFEHGDRHRSAHLCE